MGTIDYTKASVISGIICTALVLILTIVRQRRFDVADFGTFLGAFFSGSNIPPAVFLCMYVFVDDPLLQQTKLNGYEKYIALAGLALFLSGLIGVWKLCKHAWDHSTDDSDGYDGQQ